MVGRDHLVLDRQDDSGGGEIRRRLGHLDSLDSLRGVAILLVMWFHLPPSAMPVWNNWLVSAARPGYFGVDIFFALSGFLITRILISDIESSHRIWNFYVKRVFRIFPCYYLLLLASVIVEGCGQDIVYASLYFSNFALLLGPFRGSLHHLWSLAVEEHFYLFWPLLVFFVSKRVLRLLSLVLIPLVACVVAILHGVALSPFVAMEASYYSTFTRVFTLALGSGLAVLESDGNLRRLLTIRRVGVACVVSLALLFVSKSVLPIPLWPLARLLFAGIISTGIVAITISLNGGMINRFANGLGLAKIGTISYALYLLHQPIYSYFGLFDLSRTASPLSLFAAMGCSVLAASLSLFLIERPIMRQRHRFLR